MLANRLLLSRGVLSTLRRVGVRYSHDEGVQPEIGNRDLVGFGINGKPVYYDREDYPMPALRWKENTPDVLALREKEKCDWKTISIEEKKAIYRASFCQTFSEFLAPTGEWKLHIGWVLAISSLALWWYMGLRTFVYPPLPDSMTEENQKKQLKMMIDMKFNPIEGLASKWDYENNRWKK